MPEIMYGRYLNDNWTPAEGARLCAERRYRLGFVSSHRQIPLADPDKRTKHEIKETTEPSPSLVIESTPEPGFALSGPKLTDILPVEWSPYERLAIIINVLSIAAKVNPKGLITCRQICHLVARVFAVDYAQLIGNCRQHIFLIPRHLAMCLSSLLTQQSVACIGVLMRHHHTSVISANNKHMLRLVREIMDQGNAPLVELMVSIIESRGSKFRKIVSQDRCFKEATE
jgi:hypothetical protein